MTGIPATCELWIDGARYADGCTGEADSDPAAMSGLTLTWGRDSTIDQPEPASLTFTILDGPGGVRFDETIALGSKVVVWSVVGGRRVVVFGGRVTDLESSYDDAADAGRCSVVAADLLADLANRDVGDEPWPAESLLVRARRIAAAAGVPAANLTADTRPAALTVSRVDVDRQQAATLLTDLATTGTAALWVVAGTDGVARLRFEDPTARPGLWVLGLGADGLWRPMLSAGAGRALDSCVIDRDPVRWKRALSDLITRVTVRWLDQTTTPDTTERTLSVIDSDVESIYGARGISIGTILTTEAAASSAANLLLATHQDTNAWRAAGLAWDLADTVDPGAGTAALAADLLDNSTRYGLPVTITPMPEWVPAGAEAGLYVDGGTYTFSGGRWTLSLATTSAVAGGQSLTYEATPAAVTYAAMAPEVSFLDLIGVGPPPAGPAADDTGRASGLPVPAPTDPYRTVPAALAALAAAVMPRFANRPIQFVTGTWTVNAAGGAGIDQRDTMTAVDGAIVVHEAGADPGRILGTTTVAATVAGTQPFRVFTAAGTANQAAANVAVRLAAILWGTAR